MVEGCGGGFEADVGGGGVRVLRVGKWLIRLGVDVKGRRFPA